MSYRLKATEPMGDALRRVIRERLDHAIRGLTDGRHPDTAVHDARKDIKKLRSLLRLMRPDLGATVVGRENAALRDASALLAASRDAAALAETVQALAERYVGRVPHAAFTALAEGVGAGGEEPAGDPAALEAGAAALADIRERVAGWPLERCDWRTARRGLHRTYRRGRDALATVDDDPTTQHLHDWRKRAKDLWYQQRLIADAWPPILKAQANQARLLTQIIGDDHDLSELRAVLLDGDVVVAEQDEIVGFIDERRAELLVRARSLGRRVYAESPQAHRRRTARYVRAMRADRTRHPA